MTFVGKAAVIGATGRQGGATARAMLERGWTVRALTRNRSQPAAQGLASLGIEVVEADLEDRDSLADAFAGMDGLFALTNFWDGAPGPILGAEGEVRQGLNIVQAASQARIDHVVFSSAAGSFGHPSRMAHVASKQRIERALMSGVTGWTVLRPVFFMENLTVPWMGVWSGIVQGSLSLPMSPSHSLQMVTVEDVGAFAALALSSPDTFKGVGFDIAGDQLTGPEMAAALARHLGKPVAFTGSLARIEELRKDHPESAVMWDEINAVGTNAFIPGLRAVLPGLTSFEGFLRKSNL